MSGWKDGYNDEAASDIWGWVGVGTVRYDGVLMVKIKLKTTKD